MPRRSSGVAAHGMSSQPDRSLADAQAALLGALTGRNALPEGFAAPGARAMESVLLAKRRRAAAHECPSLPRELGEAFLREFDAYAGATPRSPREDAVDDAARFVQWLRRRGTLSRALGRSLLALRLRRGLPVRAMWVAEGRWLFLGYRSWDGRARCVSIALPGHRPTR